MSEHDDLLQRFLPRLRYDSNEQYFADSPAQWTDNPGHELRRADGTLLARAPALSLGLLGAAAYSDGREAKPSDFISDPRRDYRAQYVKLRVARPDLSNRVYGHAVEENGRLWLQYWLWYFYNDYSLALNAGLHEGDWEMVQLRMHDDEPDVAVYAQHTNGEKRPWTDVEQDDGHPVVYVARGSHASYFEAGFHTTEAWYDIADGKRTSPELTLEILDDDGPGWARWPGRWGDTQPRLPGGIQQPSPTGPGVKKQWSATRTRCSTRRARQSASRRSRRPRWRSPAPATGCASPSTSSAATRRRARWWSRSTHATRPACRRAPTRSRSRTPARHAQHPHPDRPDEALRRLHEHDGGRPADAVGVDADLLDPVGDGRAPRPAGVAQRPRPCLRVDPRPPEARRTRSTSPAASVTSSTRSPSRSRRPSSSSVHSPSVPGHRLVDRAGDGAGVGAVGAQLDRLAAARGREGVVRGAEHRLVRRVLLVRVHPAPREAIALPHYRPASFLRGPASVAFMRAAWPWVNMNIAASST